MNPALKFAVSVTDGAARAATLTLGETRVQTPVFMPVGTQASVKTQTPDEVQASGSRLILANTYHLWLRPGAELVAQLGGVGRFMAWPHAVLTDSGGYQVFSLSELRRIEEEGVTFRSHLDGSKHLLSPERSMEVQALLGANIAMLFDECPPGGAGRDVVARAVERTTRWAKRSLLVEAPQHQARFSIAQGGTFVDLRLSHIQDLAELNCEGMALGGFSVGEPIEEMYRVVSEVGPLMPAERPRYLMGVGKPIDLLRAIGSGIDMFDCVLPTRNARNGQALTWDGRVNLKQARHREDQAPLSPACGCPVCGRYTRAYLRHLIVAGETLGGRLLTQHNLHFFQDLTSAARHAIVAGRYASFAREAEARMREGDEIGRS